jgi:hypothetical protein
MPPLVVGGGERARDQLARRIVRGQLARQDLERRH